MKIILIGSEGFTGKYTYQLLKDYDFDVFPVDIKTENNTYQCDIRYKDQLEKIPINQNDIVVHLAAKQYHKDVPSKNKRNNFFFDTNFYGTKNILEMMVQNKCMNMIYFTTDMVYGKPNNVPVNENHGRNPFGPYGKSKVVSENLCDWYRKNKNFNITIFRPRLIMGPGRLGILEKLFKLIKYNLPVPLIGNGKNYYQMISVYDCALAILLAIKSGIPNENFNLGSLNPPNVESLLKNLIKKVNSKSFILKTPAKIVKSILRFMDDLDLSIMYPEQFMIADENYLLDISKAQNILNWVPQYNDQDMIFDAYKYFIKSNGQIK